MSQVVGKGTGGRVAETGGGPGLKQDVLNLKDIAFSAVANIGPALSLFALLALIVGDSSGAGPATILIGMVAILLVGNSLTQFARHTPTAGSFVTWIKMGLGPAMGRFTVVVVMLGYLVALSGVLVAAAGVTQLVIGNWTTTVGSWLGWMVLFAVGGLLLLIRGVKLSTNVVVLLFAFEALVLIALAAATLVGLPAGRGLSGAPFTNLNYAAIASAFPLVVTLFVGWENAGALSEETQKPRRNVGLSVLISVLATGIIYAFVTYAAELGFPSLTALTTSASPLDALAGKYFGGAHSILDFAILTSALSLFLAASNSQARILFNAGRAREFPKLFGVTHRRYHTPYAALSVFVVAAFALGAIWTELLNGKVFTYVSVAFTVAPLLLMIVYALLCVALPVYYWREHRGEFNWLLHVIVPAAGIAILVNPFYESVKPGPGAFGSIPWATLIGVAAGIAFALGRSIMARRRVPEEVRAAPPSA
jgi:amino acid transporter